MPLNDVAIRAAKPGPKSVKLSDEKGLFLLATFYTPPGYFVTQGTGHGGAGAALAQLPALRGEPADRG